jgi:hypothetical protein
MISALPNMRRLILSLLLSSFVPVFAVAPVIAAPQGSDQRHDERTQAEFSADDFDWRTLVPSLFVAADLPGQQGIKAILENFTVLRTYVANQVRSECRQHMKRCAMNGEHVQLQAEVSKRIDRIVQEGIFYRHRIAIVDYPLTHQPYPFSEIVALKREKHRDAYLVLELSDHSYTAAQLQSKYGVPFDTNVVEWYGVYKYKLDTARYSCRTVFEIDPVDGAVIRVAISLKRKSRA